MAKNAHGISSLISPQRRTIRAETGEEVKAMTQNRNTANVPESREALDNMKYEVAQEMGVNLKKGYNGDLTAKENGTVGGNMVKKMIENYERKAAGQQQ